MAEAERARRDVLGRLQLAAGAGFEAPAPPEPVPAEAPARTNAAAVRAIDRQLDARAGIVAMRSGPHVHGNLEALPGSIAGIAIGFMAAPRWPLRAASWTFIGGALLLSGMRYLAVVVGRGWAGVAPRTGIGPLQVPAGLLLAGIAAGPGRREGPQAA